MILDCPQGICGMAMLYANGRQQKGACHMVETQHSQALAVTTPTMPTTPLQQTCGSILSKCRGTCQNRQVPDPDLRQACSPASVAHPHVWCCCCGQVRPGGWVRVEGLEPSGSTWTQPPAVPASRGLDTWRVPTCGYMAADSSRVWRPPHRAKPFPGCTRKA
jgi:hypothetical protein